MDSRIMNVFGLMEWLEQVKRALQLRPSAAIPLSIPIAAVRFFAITGFLEKSFVRTKQVGPTSVATNLHRWMVNFVGEALPPTSGDGSDYWGLKLPAKAAERLIEEGPLFDYLVVDEAQDLLTPEYLDVFDVLLAGGISKGRWVFLGDFSRQDIFAQKQVSKAEFKQRWASRGFASYRLTVNCRNTREISEYVTLLGRLAPSYSATLRGDTHQDPDLLFYQTSEDQSKQAIAALDDFLAGGFRPGDIVILSPKEESSCVHALLQNARWKNRLKRYPGAYNSIRHCTIHAFKGLEAPAIILVDIEGLDSEIRADLFYIGMSRALHRLAILAHSSMKEEIRALL